MTLRRTISPLLALACLLCVLAAPAQAQRALLDQTFLGTDQLSKPPIPPPEGEVEGACGLAAIPGGVLPALPEGGLYVSDYYHGVVDLFSSKGEYVSQTAAGLHPEGPCGLAADSTGRLYVNLWHQSALRLIPDVFGFVPGHVTAIAVDPATDYLYVDHHNLEHKSYVSVYLPTGESADPIEIGFGSLGDAYGIAAFAGRLYVADATDQLIKVYEPAIDPSQPAFTIAGFNSLTDSALAIDPTNGHLLVVDNTQPGYEHPISAVYEFAPDGTPLGRLPGKPVFGKPSGVAVNPETGALYVTDGNSELSNVFAYGPYQEGAPPLSPVPSSLALGPDVPTTQAAPSASARSMQRAKKHRVPHRPRPRPRHRHRHHRNGFTKPSLAKSDVAQPSQ